MVPPAIITALASVSISAKCTAGFSNRNLSDELLSLSTTQAVTNHKDDKTVYSVSQKKSPPRVFWKIFPNGWEFLINFLHTYYAIIYTLDYKFLFKYLL